MRLSIIVLTVFITMTFLISCAQNSTTQNSTNGQIFTTTCTPTQQACADIFGKDFVYVGATRSGCPPNAIRTRCKMDTTNTPKPLAVSRLQTSPLAPTPARLSDEPEVLMITKLFCFTRDLRMVETLQECQTAGERLGLNIFPETSIPVSVSDARVQEGCTIFENPATGKVGVTFKEEFKCRKGGIGQPCNSLGGCGHDNPCPCFNDNPAPNPVCKDGVFQPDINKYYTIGSINNRFLATTRDIDSDFVVLTPDLPSYVPHRDDLTPYSTQTSAFISSQAFDPESFRMSDARVHWRFVPKGNGQYEIVGRGSGHRLQAKLNGGVDALVLHVSDSIYSNPVLFTPRCVGSMVVLDMPNNRQIMDCCDYVDKVKRQPLRSANAASNSAALAQVFLEPQTPGRILSTNKLVAPLNSMKLEHRWFIHEVTDFMRPGKFDPKPVTVNPLFSEAQIADHLASQGGSLKPTIAEGVPIVAGAVTVLSDDLLKKMKVGPPFASAALAFGLSFGLEAAGVGGGDNSGEIDILDLATVMQQALQDLADDLIARTDDLVETKIVEESARMLGNNMIARRRWFMEDYPKVKHFEIARQNLVRIDNVADRLFREVDDYQVDIETFYGLSFTPTSQNAKRSHFMLDTLKLAVTELMIMEQEAHLMKAYAQPDVPCSAIADINNLNENAQFMSDLLRKSQETLIKFITEVRKCEVDALTFTFECPAESKKNFVAETTFDIQHFSYPIQLQLDRLKNVTLDTLTKCERLRDPNDSFRSEFENDEFDFSS